MASELLREHLEVKNREAGLSDTVRAAVEAIPEIVWNDLAPSLRTGARERGFIIQQEGGEQVVIPIGLTPWVVSSEAARYLRGFFRGIRRTVNRILAHYFEDPALQAILPLREAELAWLKASCSEGIPRLQTIFERFDTNLGFRVEEQLRTFQIIEFNSVGVGCVYLMPAATELLDERLIPHLKESLNGITLSRPSDYRQLLLDEIQKHAEAIQRPGCGIALVERRETVPGGVDEFARMAPYFTARGFPTVEGDPREIEHRGGEFFLKGTPVDVVYRDFQLEEVVSIKTHGGSVEGIEAAFADNRVISTVFGEFDHKSLCELLTSPDFEKYFTLQEIKAARSHVPWTRLVEERTTKDSEGREVDLLPFARERREKLVLKPNRSYGGEGVIVGEIVSQSEWEAALQQAVAKPRTFVVQEKVPIQKAQVMILKGSGRPRLEEQYATLSVTATPRGVAFVGRCSPDPVVNITQGGAIVPVFLVGKK